MLRDKKFDGLMILIAFMAVVVCILIIAVKIKQGKEDAGQIIPETAVVEEQTTTEETVDAEDADVVEEPEVVVEEPVIVMVRTLDMVNVRATADAAGTKLATVNAGTEFEMIEQQENGWTKIVYETGEAFIKSEYLEIVPSDETE